MPDQYNSAGGKSAGITLGLFLSFGFLFSDRLAPDESVLRENFKKNCCDNLDSADVSALADSLQKNFYVSSVGLSEAEQVAIDKCIDQRMNKNNDHEAILNGMGVGMLLLTGLYAASNQRQRHKFYNKVVDWICYDESDLKPG